MGIFDKFIDREKTSQMTISDPREVFNNLLKQTSGTSFTREVEFDIFYQIYAFKGVVEGIGTSTLVANTALALAELGLTVCVVDTSVLQPVQDVLLKTDYSKENIELKDRLDWFDMPYTRKSPLHQSDYSKDISVLSFFGKNRGITDILSTNDSDALVEMAFTELHNKFDIILVDCCHELTSINTACLQMSQQVIQVWNDSPQIVQNLDNFITNCVTLSCPLDKMRFVVYSKISRDIIGNLDGLIEQYRLKKLSQIVLSEEIYLAVCTGKQLFQLPSTNQDIIDFTNCVIDIAAHICNIDLALEEKKREEAKAAKKSKKRGDKDKKVTDDIAKAKKGDSFTANDIANGEVEGTVHKKMRDQLEDDIKNGRSVEVQHPVLNEEDMGIFDDEDGGDD